MTKPGTHRGLGNKFENYLPKENDYITVKARK